MTTLQESDAYRIDRLERLVLKLAEALERKDTEQDGNWGWPTFFQELHDVKKTLQLAAEDRKRQKPG